MSRMRRGLMSSSSSNNKYVKNDESQMVMMRNSSSSSLSGGGGGVIVASQQLQKLVQSPESMMRGTAGEVLVHLSHPQHPLQRLTSPYMFTCAGCKDFGAGPRFRCETCDYELHEFCALAPPSIVNLPNSSSVHHANHQLVFHAKPPAAGGGLGLLRSSRCGMCGKTIRGYCFRCGTCNLEIHPYCSKLKQEMRFPVHPLHPMALLPLPSSPAATSLFTTTSTAAAAGMSSPAAAAASPGLAGGGGDCRCGLCYGQKRRGRVYGCETCGYQIHAVCAKPMVNGLYSSGIIRAPDNHNNNTNNNNKPTMLLGTAARVASHVILGFIGGLIEGIGEGIGEALVDNKGKGKGKGNPNNPNNPNSLITTYLPPSN
ncbi:hypothetical protein Syun_005700 [Stephania yunnanensis]|uniref:DC1 domain-containing protein n=1 Tax=Stephania yunnanensis TaxID=152371 RepID=A0AAP0Q2I5_9MAGN